MALFHCLTVVISSLLVVWIMEKVGIINNKCFGEMWCLVSEEGM